MPTYNFACQTCGRGFEVFRTIGEHMRNARPFFCCGGVAERTFPPTNESVLNPLAGDRHYDGMRAQDGTDISTRTKHRAYMKANGLTTVDDFTETWKQAEKQRDLYRTGKGGGAVTKADLAETIHRLTSGR